MSTQLVVPSFGESVTEVVIEEWLVNEGDAIAEDDLVVSLESDKATLEVPSPTAGVLSKFLKKVGETAQVGEAIAEIAEAGSTTTSAAARPAAVATAPTQTPPRDPEPARAEVAPAPAAEPVMGPAARRLVAEHGIDASSVEASGPAGRLLKEDVLEAVAKPPQKAPSPTTAPPTAPKTTPTTAAPPAKPAATAPAKVGDRTEDPVPMSPIRRVIAQRLVHATQTTAMLTTFNEVDLSRIIALRKTYRDTFEKRHGVRLGFMSFFIKASIEALKLFPQLNAEIRDDHIVYKNFYDIGVAVSGKKGLAVPVIRNADTLSFAALERTVTDLGIRARDNKLGLDELQGGTFTISNGGVFGSMLSTPILNPPQSGVLGMHNIVKRPVVVTGDNGEDQIAIRPVMYVALTYDHRIVDGREAVRFLFRIKECVENPDRLLLEV